MNHSGIKEAQLEFYRKHRAGCSFAGVAARDPEYYGWQQYVISDNAKHISQTIDESIVNDEIKMMSMIFPSVTSVQKLEMLIATLQDCPRVSLGLNEIFQGYRCYGLRLQVGEALSWMSGFGDFDFLPATRQSPFTEITVRVKPRPKYDWVLKEHPDNTIHLADLEMPNIPDEGLKRLWESSFSQTERILGQKTDLRSAAKTTFAIPVEL